MASSASTSTTLECPVCTLPFSADTTHKNVPKLFRCGHSVCAECTLKMPAAAGLVCPICRKPTPEHATKLSINYGLVDVIAAAATTAAAAAKGGAGASSPHGGGGGGAASATAPASTHGNDASSVPLTCAECEEHAATIFCENCDVAVCDACFSITHASKIMKTHKTLPVAERARKAERLLCKEHNETMLLFCATDRQVLCAKCHFSPAHRGHDVRLIEDMAKEVRAGLDQEMAALRAKANELEEAARVMERTVAAVGAAAGTATAQINARFDELVREVRTRQQQLLKRVEEMKVEKERALGLQQGQLTDALARIAAALEAADKAKDESDAALLNRDPSGMGRAALEHAGAYATTAPAVDPDIHTHLPGDGQVEAVVRGFGSVGGPAPPVLVAVGERDVTSMSVKVGWNRVESAVVYDVELRQVPEDECGSGGGSGEGGAGAAAGTAAAAAAKDTSIFQQVYRGAENTTTINNLERGTRYWLRVRGVGAGGVVGKWSQVRMVETKRMLNVFSGMRGNADWSQVGGQPLRCVGDHPSMGRTALGRQEIEVRAGSGQVGYVQARVVASSGRSGHASLGLAARSVVVSQGQWLGGVVQTMRCQQSGLMQSQLQGCAAGRTQADSNVGDAIGLMVDCRAAPLLRLFVNGVLRHTQPLTMEGIWVRPGATVFSGEMEIADDPELPEC